MGLCSGQAVDIAHIPSDWEEWGKAALSLHINLQLFYICKGMCGERGLDFTLNRDRLVTGEAEDI